MTTAQDGDPRDPKDIATDAIRYALQRVRTDPDLWEVCCPMTETFNRLVKALAALTGKDPDVLRSTYAQDWKRGRKSRRELLLDRVRSAYTALKAGDEEQAEGELEWLIE